MGHEIDLKKYNIRSDLIIESISNNEINIDKSINKYDDILVTRIILDKKSSKIIGKDEGNYITIEFKDISDSNNSKKVEDIFIQELSYMLNIVGFNYSSKILVIGLGNINSTPDSLGPLVINKVMVTRHLFLLNLDIDSGIREVSTFKPGVMADTGMETSDIIVTIVNNVKPDIVLVIDALASSSISSLNKNIQITNTGISPGSGIGNNRKKINKDIIKIPVVCIGVPTVVESSVIVSDTLDFLLKHIAYIKNNFYENKLVFNKIDYINKSKNSFLTNTEKKDLLGLIGELSSSEQKNLINEVLSSFNYNLIVTPKEIDFQISKMATLIGDGINRCLHKIDVKK